MAVDGENVFKKKIKQTRIRKLKKKSWDESRSIKTLKAWGAVCSSHSSVEILWKIHGVFSKKNSSLGDNSIWHILSAQALISIHRNHTTKVRAAQALGIPALQYRNRLVMVSKCQPRLLIGSGKLEISCRKQHSVSQKENPRLT